MTDYSPGRRAASYWFADGLPDIVLGTNLLIFGAAGILWQVCAPHAWVYDLWLMLVGFALFYWKERAAIDFLKSHLTYPRTGYAQPPEEASPPASLTTLSLRPTIPPDENVTHFARRTVLVFWYILYLSFIKDPPPWLAPLLMVALATTLYLANRESERPFPWWSTLILALTGLVFLWVDVPRILQPMLSMLMAGAWLLAQGVFTLINYVRANPRPETPEGVRA